VNRRDFLKSTTSASLLAQSKVLGANDRVRIGLIGAGGRGNFLAGLLASLPGNELVSACDVYEPRRQAAAKKMGSQAEATGDYRRVLDRRDVDAVVIATPDHWHTPMTLEAVAAGKDVYVEKPVTHHLSEGDALVAGVEKSGRVVATGTQQRSWDHFILARQLIESGRLGQIAFVRSYWYQNYLHARPPAAIDPAHLDWDKWLGPAPRQPFDLIRLRRWRLFWDFGGGVFTDLMTHWIDVIQWYMNSPLPKSVHAVGSTHALKGVETPDTVTATILFPNHYTVLYYGSMIGRLEGGGIVFRGTRGMMTLTRDGFEVYGEPETGSGEKLPPPDIVMRSTGDGTLTNLANWLDCIRSRKTPNANVRAGVEAARTSHWANVAMREHRVVES
jgi:predicted dehydrogenase